jgi:hypothetical protein
MAKQEFLENFRVARNLFAHPRVQSDSPHIDTGAVVQALARAAIWLTPKSVKGFNAADFPELGLERQRELQDAYLAFMAVAKEVPPDEPATEEQYGNAAVAFAKLLEILEPYLPSPEEGKQVETALKSIDFPPWVVNWDYELASDEEGGPAVWINFYADRKLASPKDFARFAAQVTQTIHRALSENGVTRWPYVRVRTTAEHKSM